MSNGNRRHASERRPAANAAAEPPIQRTFLTNALGKVRAMDMARWRHAVAAVDVNATKEKKTFFLAFSSRRLGFC
jgi:hypothetical protein